MPDFFKDVVVFNEAARGELPRHFTPLSLENVKLCLRLILEESFECFEALLAPSSKALHEMRAHKDCMQAVLTQRLEEVDLEQDGAELLDGVNDTVVVTMGLAALAGLPFNEGMEVVCQSNLAKIDPVSKMCIKDAGGKIQKPHGWVKPDLEAVMRKVSALDEGNRAGFASETKLLQGSTAIYASEQPLFPGIPSAMSSFDGNYKLTVEKIGVLVLGTFEGQLNQHAIAAGDPTWNQDSFLAKTSL